MAAKQEPESVSIQSVTERNLLPHLLNNHLNWGHSISLWRLPDSDEKHLLVSTEGVKLLTDIVLEESPAGFVFSPFDHEKAKLFLKGDLIFTFKNGQLLREGKSTLDPLDLVTSDKKDQIKGGYFFKDDRSRQSTRQDDYKKLVEKSIAGISEGLFEKGRSIKETIYAITD